MKELVFAVILGIGAGGLYAMLATGLVTAFKGSGVINFAHGAFAMYTVYVFDELSDQGDLVLPWVDILPGHSPNIPVRIISVTGRRPARGALVLWAWPHCLACSPTSSSSGRCATLLRWARSSVQSASCSISSRWPR